MCVSLVFLWFYYKLKQLTICQNQFKCLHSPRSNNILPQGVTTLSDKGPKKKQKIDYTNNSGLLFRYKHAFNRLSEPSMFNN